MNSMEIERKFTVKALPANLEQYAFHIIEQAYLCTSPVIRIRRQDDEYYVTYKGSGLMTREEYNLPLTKEAYAHLLPKADGNIIVKKRYLIPLTASFPLIVELDVFDAPFAPLVIAEVEFPDEETADRFLPPDWFAKEVTLHPEYHNSYLSRIIF